MFKFLLAPLAAAFVFVAVAPVSAAVIIRVPVKPATTPGAPPSTNDSTSPGDAFYPEGSRRSGVPTDTSSIPDPNGSPGNPGGGSGNPGGNPGIDPTTTASTGGNGAGVEQPCGSDLGKLRRVTANAVRGVGYGDNVDVIPLCTGRSLNAMQRNVEGLHAPISQNDTMVSALRQEGFGPSQVVGVVVNGPMVVLYVH